MSTRLILIRHGQSEHNVAQRFAGWTDSALTPHGLAEAALTADYLATNYQLDALYCSPLERAFRTALIIGERLGLEPTVEDRLKEIHFGDLEDLTPGEAEERYPLVWTAASVYDDESFGWPGGETRLDFYTRIRLAFADIVGRHHAHVVGIVAHGGVLGTYLADAVRGKASLWRDFLLDNCSITELELDDAGRAILVACNETGHLPAIRSESLIVGTARELTESDS